MTTAPLMNLKHDGEVSLAKGTSRRDIDWKNGTVLWSQLLAKLSKTRRTPETLAEYKQSSLDKKGQIKDVGGFTPAILSGPRRKKENILKRTFLTFDLDSAYPGQLDDLFIQLPFAWAAYSTHSHTPEAPRLRVCVPTSRHMEIEEHDAVARKVAQMIGLETLDQSTFDINRLMYWPSTSVDGEFLFQYSDLPWLDVDKILASYGPHGAWRNVALWPTVPGESRARASSTSFTGAKKQDPRDIPGVIGAFCGIYSTRDVLLDRYSSDYEESQYGDGRATFLGGSTTNGIVFYDDDQFIVSNHSTDPLFGHGTINAADIIRIREFAHLDDPEAQDAYDMAGLASRPSHQALVKYLYSLPEVAACMGRESATAVARAEAAQDKRDEKVVETAEARKSRMDALLGLIEEAQDANSLEIEVARRVARSHDAFTDSERALVANAIQKRTKVLIGGHGVALATIKKWLMPMSELLPMGFPHTDEEGRPKETIENVEALCAMRGVKVRYDVIHHHLDIVGEGFAFTRENRDNNCLSKMFSLCKEVGLPVSLGSLKGYLGVICEKHQYNPVAEWLESEPWDGVDRLPDLLATLTLTDDTDPKLAMKILRRWMIQAVALAMSPIPLQGRGVLVLQGPQNIGKSRWMVSLLPGHENLALTGVQLRVDNKDSVKTATSYWISELGELDATFKKSEISALKGFLAQTEDTLRLPYAPTDSTFQRRTSFFASVNPNEFLNDDTGNTRYWSIAVSAVDHTHNLEMQQVWAQILHLWRSGETHYATHEEMTQIEHNNTRFATEDPIAEKLEMSFAWEEAELAHARGEEWKHWMMLCTSQVLAICGYRNPGKSEQRIAGGWMQKRLPGRKPVRKGSVMLRPVPIHEGDEDRFKHVLGLMNVNVGF